MSGPQHFDDISHEPGFVRANRRRLLGEVLTRNAINFPDRTALHDIESGWTLTNRAFEQRVNAAAHGLLAKGIRPGDRIAMLGRNYLDSLTIYYASSRIGAVVVPLNSRATTEELRYILDDSTPVASAVSTEFLDQVDASLWRGTTVFSFGPEPDSGELADWVMAGSTDPPDLDVDDRAPAFILYTGGTTGKPKGVTLCQAGYVTMADNTIHALSPQRIGRTDAWLVVGPLYHGAALAYSVTGLHFAQTVHLLREFDAAKTVAAVAKGFGSVTWFIPTMSRRIVDHIVQNNVPTASLDGLRLIVSAGAPLDLSLRRELLATFRQAQIVDIVGQTELTSTIVALSESRDISSKPTGVGMPMPGMTVAILDDDNRQVETGEIGELCYRSECLMLGYWNKPELTVEAMAGGWFHSGDLARRDADGVVFLVGRKKEIIKSGGENIVPNEIEDVIRELPEVLDACVIGLKDPEWGERVHAVIARGTSDVDRDGLRARAEAHCRERLSRYKVPKSWTVIELLPTNAIGKVDKARLREIAETGESTADVRPLKGSP